MPLADCVSRARRLYTLVRVLSMHGNAHMRKGRPAIAPRALFLVLLSCGAITATPQRAPGCMSFCKDYLLCTCSRAGTPTGIMPPREQCEACVKAHAANFSEPRVSAIPCSVQRALILCGGPPRPPPGPSPPGVAHAG